MSPAPIIATVLMSLMFIAGSSVRFVFNDHGNALATTHAHGGTAIAATFLLENTCERSHQPAAGGAQWMADGDSAALDIDLFRVDAELLDCIQGNDGEGLVDLPVIDV